MSGKFTEIILKPDQIRDVGGLVMFGELAQFTAVYCDSYRGVKSV